MRTVRPTCATLLLLALCCVAGGGCSSSRPTRFYTLYSVAGEPAAKPQATPRVIALGPVLVPDYVDRPQLVTRPAPGSLDLATFDSWAGPLAAMIQRVLLENVAARLPGDRIVPFPRVSSPQFAYRVVVELSRFDVDAGGDAVVAAAWQIYDRGGATTLLMSDTLARVRAASDKPEDRVAALSAAIGQLSDDVVRGLLSLHDRGS